MVHSSFVAAHIEGGEHCGAGGDVEVALPDGWDTASSVAVGEGLNRTHTNRGSDYRNSMIVDARKVFLLLLDYHLARHIDDFGWPTPTAEAWYHQKN
jgi:hypothetical protein